MEMCHSCEQVSEPQHRNELYEENGVIPCEVCDYYGKTPKTDAEFMIYRDTQMCDSCVENAKRLG